MKSLDKAIEDYEKAKAKAEQLQAKAAEAVRKMKECEAAKIEAENMEYARIIREMNLTVPELLALQKRMKYELPGAVIREEDYIEKEELGEKQNQ